MSGHPLRQLILFLFGFLPRFMDNPRIDPANGERKARFAPSGEDVRGATRTEGGTPGPFRQRRSTPRPLGQRNALFEGFVRRLKNGRVER